MKPYTTIHFVGFGEGEKVRAEGREVNGRPSITFSAGSESHVTITFLDEAEAIAFLPMMQAAVRQAIEAAHSDNGPTPLDTAEPAKDPS